MSMHGGAKVTSH